MEKQQIISNNKWGIIYCPKKGDKNSKKLQHKLSNMLDTQGISYCLKKSNKAETVPILAKNIIDDGYKTIIVVGGDTALNDVVNTVVRCNEDNDLNDISIGLIPNGRTNAFANFWGIKPNSLEHNINFLKKGRVRKVDLGVIKYVNNNDERCIRYFLSSFTMGLVSTIINLRRKTHTLSNHNKFSFIPSSLLAIFEKTQYNIEMKINEESVGGQVMTICVGNTPWYGTTPSAVPYNGMLDVLIVGKQKVIHKIKSLYLLYTGKIFNGQSVRPYRTKNIEVQSVGNAMVCVDGRKMLTPKGKFSITITPEKFNFIIPQE